MSKVLQYIEIDADYCSLTFGVAPCTAGTQNKLLLHLDGADASTAIVDSSGNARPNATVFGNAQLDTAFAKFGTASLLLDGTGDYLEFPASEDWNFYGDDFTIDWWERRTNIVGARPALGRDNVNITQGWVAGYCDGTNNLFFAGNGGGTWNIVNGLSMGAVELNAWHHFAVSRQGNTFRTFRDGALVGTATSPSHFLAYATPVSIGARNQGAGVPPFQGNIDEVRILKGFAAFTASFPVPTTPGDKLSGTGKCFNTIATCQDRPNFTNAPATLRFAFPTDYLPADIECIPNLKSVSFEPAVISLGKDLGQRATLTASFEDHRHSDTGAGGDKYLADRSYDPYLQGTFWGKFAARQPFMRGRRLRWITGTLGQTLAEMETRHYLIDSISGPSNDAVFKVIAKDLLKLADGDRALAPAVSPGFLVADMTAAQGSFTISAGAGASYPANGYVAIGGTEIVSFNRSVDVFTITRGHFNTPPTTHSAQDRVQLVLRYSGIAPDIIIADLLENYADVDPAYIPADDWRAEIASHLNRVYTGTIAQPTAVNELISELIEQAGLSLWWDDRNQEIGLLVLRGLLYTNDLFSDNNMVGDTLDIAEQPDKRLSQIHTYFGQINPLTSLTDKANFRSASIIKDAQTESDYGSPAIREIFSRWIPALGRTVADRLGAILIGRFKHPPRKISFSVLRNSTDEIVLANGYQVQGWPLQLDTGAPETVNVQVTRLRPSPDMIQVETEEVLFTAPVEDLSTRRIIVDANINNIDLRAAHDSLFPAPIAGNIVVYTINPGVLVGSNHSSWPSIWVGSRPAGVGVVIHIAGRVQGAGGQGGHAGYSPPLAGTRGGDAIYTRFPIYLSNVGELWSGGGGGGAGGRIAGTPFATLAGCGGAGTIGGQPGGNDYGNIATAGTATAGGTAIYRASGGGPGSNGEGFVANGGAAGFIVNGYTNYVTPGTWDGTAFTPGPLGGSIAGPGGEG